MCILYTKIGSGVLISLLIVGVSGCGGSSSGVVDNESAGDCMDIENTISPDTDSDGLSDVCDDDDDGDGFNDSDDPLPLDRSVPGDFSTAEAILNNPVIIQAINDSERLGFSLSTQTAPSPPDLTGYYSRADRLGNSPFNSSGIDQSRSIAGREFRLDQAGDNTYETAGLNFSDLQPISFGFSKNSQIRGEGNEYTTYSRFKNTCTLDNSNYDTFFVSIVSANVNPDTGDLENGRSLLTTVATAGERTSACDDILVGDQELVGAWSVNQVSLTQKVQPSELIYMCVEDNAAYAPTETWFGSDGRSCSCARDYMISCE